MKRTNPPQAQQIEMLAIEAFKSDGFLIVNKTLIKQFGLITAVLLSNYIDKHVYFRKKYPDNNGWFYLTHEQQMEQLGIKEHSLRKCKKELVAIDLLTIERRGIPAREWYKINFIKLTSLLGQHLLNSTVQHLLDPTGHIINIKENKLKENKKINNSPAQERNKIYLPIAKYLSGIIQSNKKIEHTPIQLKTWTNDIRQLVEDNKVDAKRIKSALKWYKQNIGGQYIPVIESGQSLRYKFAKLEGAIERSKNSYGDEKPDSFIADGEWWHKQPSGSYKNKAGVIFTE